MNVTEKLEVYHELLSQCDGPVTPFVAISRAIELAYANTYNVEEISNALSDALDFLANNGDLPTNEFKPCINQ